MKNLLNNATGKRKLKMLIPALTLVAYLYTTNAMAQPFVSVYKNGTPYALPIHSFGQAKGYKEIALYSADSMNQGLWLTLPVLGSSCLLLFFLSQFLIQIVRDKRLTEE